jgi:two-component system cell cycle response regulator DivK
MINHDRPEGRPVRVDALVAPTLRRFGHLRARSSDVPIVLLVQPERDDRDMYAEALRYHGVRPVLMSTAEDALTVAGRVDVIVTGILLPGPMDGIGFIARLKSDPRTNRIPVIVLTACAYQSDRDRAFGAGGDGFLAKPCLPDVLLDEIHRVLARPRPALRRLAGASNTHHRLVSCPADRGGEW